MILLDMILMLVIMRGEVVGVSTRFMVSITRVAKLKLQAEVCFTFTHIEEECLTQQSYLKCARLC